MNNFDEKINVFLYYFVLPGVLVFIYRSIFGYSECEK